MVIAWWRWMQLPANVSGIFKPFITIFGIMICPAPPNLVTVIKDILPEPMPIT